MADFLGALGFLVAVVLLGAGTAWLAWEAVLVAYPGADEQLWLIFPVGAVSIYATYRLARLLHALLDRHIVNRR